MFYNLISAILYVTKAVTMVKNVNGSLSFLLFSLSLYLVSDVTSGIVKYPGWEKCTKPWSFFVVVLFVVVLCTYSCTYSMLWHSYHTMQASATALSSIGALDRARGCQIGHHHVVCFATTRCGSTVFYKSSFQMSISKELLTVQRWLI